jgi:hypothetical protein
MVQTPNAGSGAAQTAKRMMLVLMGGAGLVLLGGGGILLGLNSHLTALQTLTQNKEKEVGSSEQITKRYETTLESYNQTQSRIQYLEASVSPKSYVPTLLGQLQTLATTTHLNVTAVRPAAPPPPAPAPARVANADGSAPSDLKKAPPPPVYDTINIDVDVTGTYANTALFLYSLTRFPKIISVTSVQMHPGGMPTGGSPYASPSISTNLKLVAFMLHDDGSTTTPAASDAAQPKIGLSTAIIPGTSMSPAAIGTISQAAGHTAASAAGVTKAANDRTAVGISNL